MTQNRLALQQPHPATSHGEIDGEFSQQYSRGQVMMDSNNIGFNQDKIYNQSNKFGSGMHGKQFDSMQPPHPFNDNYVSEFGINLTNQCINPPNQYGDFVNQYGNRPSTGNFSHHSPSLTLHQMTAGGLVQSSNELPPHVPPPTPPIPPPAQSPNSSLHCISPSGKQNNYLHSTQTGTQSSAHRTQRVS